ncbi:hypothetical protein NGF19_08670 [Streptomyces sp. RY43-2]|uniref:Uncharacterized protein n=1 Tax=Streptomyces macrolidinus TaxID=2952607 RepID=A0ABT0ZAR2_9ACTN|nr:hypothetical protein [Streptomyces macrolidinus]MCN9240865.1 hypothetical protein [Streptomyces macrolidinus]
MGNTLFPVQRKPLGWALRIAGWILRVVGVLAVVVAVQRLRTLSATTNAPYYDGPPWYSQLIIYLGVMLAGSVVFTGSLLMGRRARARTARLVASVAGLAPGSYVLYLRPFTQDLSSSGIAPGVETGSPFGTVMRSGRTYEERLSRMFRRFGPLVAIGRPGESLPGGSGARRTYLPLDDWKDTVGELIDNARLIILGAGPGPGTVWEYVEILRRRDPSRLVVLVTDPVDYQRFKTSTIAEAEGVLFELKQKYGDFWQPPVLPDLPAPVNPKAARDFYFKAMIYFAEGWEPRLAHFDGTAVKGGKPRRANKYFAERLRPVMTHISEGARSRIPPP